METFQHSGAAMGMDYSQDGVDQQVTRPSRERSDANGNRRPSGSSRICTKCGEGLVGQFVRALDGTFHLECFTCHDCGKIVASKFFPVPDQGPNQYPLCEVDYFKRLDLLCYECGGALRGSYITALDRKYHIEHFTCSVCPTVFGASDSYYEHDGRVFCHYHYSTRFAQRCNGCQTAILKQFVEIFRNGKNQHWHPECYMIHKYWNVRLHTPGQAIMERGSVDGDAPEEERRRVRREEEKIEEQVLWIWRTLSAYEEKSATCISDMLLHVSNGAYVDGVMAAKKFIIHVELLFKAADDLDTFMTPRLPRGLSYSREAKLLCKKVVAFFQLLAESQNTGVRRLGVTQELLSLVTGLAHYLKLLIRICLQGTLKMEREADREEGLRQFLDEINTLDTKLETEESSDPTLEMSNYVRASADTCPICEKAVEDRCFRHGDRVFHTSCFKCQRCARDLSQDSENARWDEQEGVLLCNECAGDRLDGSGNFYTVSRLQQYIHLLRVAHARLLATLRTSGALPHTSDDPNLDAYDANSGHRPDTSKDSLEPPLLSPATRSKSYAGDTGLDVRPPSTYEQTLGDIRRLRSIRMDKEVSNTTKHARTSRMIGRPEGNMAQTGPEGADASEQRMSTFQVVQDRDLNGDVKNKLAFTNESIRLDDIPRLVAAEQAKDQRPNANRYARGGLMSQDPKPKYYASHRREASGAQELEKLGSEGHRNKRFFSELSALEYFIVRHVAVLSMEPLLEGHFNQEELLDLIELRKPTFWGKFGKAFNKDKNKGGKKKGVFGVSIDQLIEKDGAESTDGVGPGALRVPAVVQDAVSAMRTMDMSMEGVFRKNGNIRRLKEVAEIIDTKGGDAVDLNQESPVQVAALLKKFLRELPDPVMTFKLHKLFVTSQKIADEEKRRRVLHLSCCLLPKSHRDLMEVLFCFLQWAASFSQVDEESGSKMDIHNLATVIAPNILFSNNKTEGMEDSFLAIEAVNCLIEYNESMCEVPEDLQSILNDSSLFSSSADITTKEILKRYGDLARPDASAPNGTGTATTTTGTAAAAQMTAAEANSGHTFDTRGSTPVVHHQQHSDNAFSTTPWHAESSVRPVQGGPGGQMSYGPSMMQSQFTPSQAQPQAQPQFTPPQPHMGMYAASSHANGSRDSFGNAATPSGRQSRANVHPGAAAPGASQSQSQSQQQSSGTADGQMEVT